jgi:DNA-binding XRE family transcriptional regulator
MSWTAEQKAKASARGAWRRQQGVRADPNAHPVAKARVARDLTQGECAMLAGCSPQTLSNVENGEKVSRFVQARLARVLATPQEILFP